MIAITAEQILRNAETIRDAGMPDCLNRWIGMTPELLAENETARIKITRQSSRTIRKLEGVGKSTLAKGHAANLDDVGKEILRGIKKEDRREKLEKKKRKRERTNIMKQGPKELAIRAARETDQPVRVATVRIKPTHPADVANMAAIADATSFSVSLFHDRAHEVHDGLSLVAARAKGSEMEKATGSNRLSLVYAVLKDGRSFLVPRNYQPPSTEDTMAKAATKSTTKSKASKPTTARRKPAKRSAPATKPASNGDRNRFDWKSATEAAAKGKMPPKLDFSAKTHTSFRPRLAEVEKMAADHDLAGLKKYKYDGFLGSSISAVLRWRDLCVTALTNKPGA